jgi:hypothetical protein
MRRAVVVGVLTLVAAVGMAPASATPPMRERSEEHISLRLPAGEFCDFRVGIEVDQKVTLVTFGPRPGTWIGGILTGKIIAVVTNLQTGESVRLSIPGPTFFDVEGNVVVGTGPWLIFQPGELFYAAGVLRFETTDEGVVAELVRGRQVDLCRLLGG